MRVRGRFSFLVTVAVIGVSFLGFAGLSQGAEKAITISFNNPDFPPVHFMAVAAEAYARAIEKETNGKVKVTVFHRGGLTSSAECYEGVLSGVSDVCHSAFAFTRGRFPLMEAVDLPGYPTFTPRLTSRVAWEFYKKFRPKELAETHVLLVHAHSPGDIAMRNKPVNTLEDLKGQKIRCTGLSAKIVKALGGTPVAMAKAEQYEALQRGVVDGSTTGINELKNFKTAEVTKYTTAHAPVGYVTAFYYVMNLKKWNSLPPDIQRAFIDVSERWVDYLGKEWDREEGEGYQLGKKKGHQFIFLSPQEATRWEKAVTPLYDEYIKDMASKGLPGKEAIEYRKQLIDKYAKSYPGLQLN